MAPDITTIFVLSTILMRETKTLPVTNFAKAIACIRGKFRVAQARQLPWAFLFLTGPHFTEQRTLFSRHIRKFGVNIFDTQRLSLTG